LQLLNLLLYLSYDIRAKYIVVVIPTPTLYELWDKQKHLNYEKVIHSFNCLIFIALVFLISSCEKGDTVLTEIEDEIDKIKMQKIPTYDHVNKKVISIKYIISDYYVNSQSITLRDDFVENEYQIDNILGKVNTPGYLWKIIEDVRHFEMQEFGETRVTPEHELLISETNDNIRLPVAVTECEGDVVNIGAIAHIEFFIYLATDNPFILYGGRECVENSPYYDLWSLLGTFSPSQNIIDQIDDVWEDSKIMALRDASSLGGATNIDFHSVEICDIPSGLTPLELFKILGVCFT